MYFYINEYLLYVGLYNILENEYKYVYNSIKKYFTLDKITTLLTLRNPSQQNLPVLVLKFILCNPINMFS